MTKDEIIEMARQAGLHLYVNDIIEKPYAEIVVAFARLVAAKEREACAQIADEWSVGYPHPSRIIAAAIRARGAGICSSIGEAVSQLEKQA